MLPSPLTAFLKAMHTIKLPLTNADSKCPSNNKKIKQLKLMPYTITQLTPLISQAAARPPPQFQAAGGVLHGARQNFRTRFFHCCSSAIALYKLSSATCIAIFLTSTAHINFGLPLLLLFEWACRASESSANIACRITSCGGFLKTFPNKSSRCSIRNLLSWTALT